MSGDLRPRMIEKHNDGSVFSIAERFALGKCFVVLAQPL